MKVKELRALLESMDGDSELVISILPKHENAKPTASKAVIDNFDAIYDKHIGEGYTIPFCEAYTFDSFIKRYERLMKLGYKPVGPFECGFDTVHTQRSNHRVPLFSIKIQKCK